MFKKLIEFFSRLFKVSERAATTGKGYIYFPTLVRDREEFKNFRDETLPFWLDFYKRNGVIFEVQYVDNQGPDLIKNSPSDVIFHYAINLNARGKMFNSSSNEFNSVVAEDAVSPDGDTFKSFARYQNIDNNYFGVREIDIWSDIDNKMKAPFINEVSHYNKGARRVSLYSTDEERFAFESHYYLENSLVDAEKEVHGSSDFHEAEANFKILVPCGHGDDDYSTLHTFKTQDHSDKIIVSSTCHFLQSLGYSNSPKNYLACFANTNYGWDSAEFVKANWFSKLFGAKDHYKISGSSEFVAEFLKYKGIPMGVAAFYCFRNVDASGWRNGQNDKTMGTKDKVNGESYNYGDASFVLFGNPAFII